jgi:type I restriction enzyme S subunit
MISDVTRQPGKYLYETKEGVTDAGAKLSRRLPAGSLILSNSGTVCVPKILKVDGCIHDGFVAFPTLAKFVNLDFAHYWFEAVRPVIINENRQGVTQVNLNTNIVREMHFPLAPLDEQRRIVAEIETQFTRLEVGVASLKRVHAALKRYRASVLTAACEGRLVATEAELARRESRPYEHAATLLARNLTSRRQWFEQQHLKSKYIEPEPANAPSLPELPGGWIWGTWNQLSNWVTYGFTRPMPHVADGIPIITSQGCQQGQNRFSWRRPDDKRCLRAIVG